MPPAARLARLVLLGALACALSGLAAPSGGTVGASSVTAAPPVSVFADGWHLAPQVAPARPLPARATRSVVRHALWVRPVGAPLVSVFGMRWGRMHTGIDFGAAEGDPIHVIGDGVVIGAGYLPDEGGYGQLILVQHSGGVVTAYAHTSRMYVHAGQRVHAGDVIGLVGATGHVTGPHLHFEVRIDGVKVNPVPWLRAHGIRV